MDVIFVSDYLLFKDNVSFLIEGVIFAKLCDFVAEYDNKSEVGGILYGQKVIGRNEYIITGFTKPFKKDITSYSTFVRKDKKHFKVIKSIWLEDKTTHFIGDWHSHPIDIVNPSNEDVISWKEIAMNTRNVSKNLLFAIISKDSYSFYTFVNKKLEKLEVEHYTLNDDWLVEEAIK